MGYINLAAEDKIGILTINRTEAMNALNSDVIQELVFKLEEVQNSDIRCLIITGEGEKAFVAGADIAEMKDLSSREAEVFSEKGNELMNIIEALPVPVIAAVNGYALGGGCELALACDIRIAAANAVFGLPEVSLGILPGYGGIQRLVRAIGLARAKELIFTTNRLCASEALNLGLVNAVVEHAELIQHCRTIAQKIVGNAPASIKFAKQVANQSAHVQATHGMEISAFGECFNTEDQYEAMAAFLEKRKPKPFTGKGKG